MLASVIFVDFYFLMAQRVIKTKGVLLALSGILKKTKKPKLSNGCNVATNCGTRSGETQL